MPKWLRWAMYAAAVATGVGAAKFGYNRDATRLALMAVAGVVAGGYYLVQRIRRQG